MKQRLRPAVAALFATFSLCGNASAQPLSQLAPADEYFGRAKMSPLEITNRVRDAEVRGESYQGLMNTQSAIEDWTRKYPADPWIPSREYRMSNLFVRLHSHDGDAEAAHCRAFLQAHFPGSSYARTAPKKIAKKKHHFLGIDW